MRMKLLRIGDVVRVNAVTKMDYRNNGIKSRHGHHWTEWERLATPTNVVPFIAVVTGKRQLPEGFYRHECNTAGTWASEPDYEPAGLDVTRYVTLWEVRFSWLNKPLLVRDEDIEWLIDRLFIMPNKAPLPTYIPIDDWSHYEI